MLARKGHAPSKYGDEIVGAERVRYTATRPRGKTGASGTREVVLILGRSDLVLATMFSSSSSSSSSSSVA